ncbi:putative membrane protein, partial [Vibrio parahaemolyticus SBR10290]
FKSRPNLNPAVGFISF